jgi:hypothetical protein
MLDSPARDTQGTAPRRVMGASGGGTVQAADVRRRPDQLTGVCPSRSAPPVHMSKLTAMLEITLPVGASGHGSLSRVAALAMKRGKSVDFTGYWRTKETAPAQGSKLEPSSWSYAGAAPARF